MGMTMCFSVMEWDEDQKPNGECPDCGAETVNGVAYDQCYYSEEICKTCHSAPCDLSC